MSLFIHIIGAGRLGKSLGYLLSKQEGIKISAICNRSIESAANALRFIGSGSICQNIQELPAADVYCISSNDDAIRQVVEELELNPHLKAGSIAVHCSGLQSSELLLPLKARGLHIASIHPLRSFADSKLSVEQFPGTYCAMEGDAAALNVIEPIFTKLGGLCFSLNSQQKAAYHAAAVFASNYLVTLAEQARLCLQQAGIIDDTAMSLITNLMQGTLNNLATSKSPRQVLTGPLKRADIHTIEEHLQALTDSAQRELYKALALASLRLCEHSEAIRKLLEARL